MITREERDLRERRDVNGVDSHLAWPVSLVPPVSPPIPRFHKEVIGDRLGI